jgi:hypothetical protein
MNMTHYKAPAGQPDSCPHCGSSDQLYTRVEGLQIALRCGQCQRWVKWLSKIQAANFPAKPAEPRPVQKEPAPEPISRMEPTKPAAVGCDHRDELDRLARHLGGIERELTVIVRALGNGVGR